MHICLKTGTPLVEIVVMCQTGTTTLPKTLMAPMMNPKLEQTYHQRDTREHYSMIVQLRYENILSRECSCSCL